MLSIGFWVFVAVALAVGGLWLARRIRSWSQTEEEMETFTLQDLRELRESGEISEAEFHALRKTIIRTVEETSAEPRAKPVQPDPPVGDDGGDEFFPDVS